MWTFTSDADAADSLIIRDVHDKMRGDLMTLWHSGSGSYLDVQIFEWNGRTYQEIWNLAQFVKDGQLTQRASLGIRQIDSERNVELVIRAPNVKPEERAHGPRSHQVSIHRWDARKQTFVLFKRFVDPSKTLE